MGPREVQILRVLHLGEDEVEFGELPDRQVVTLSPHGETIRQTMVGVLPARLDQAVGGRTVGKTATATI